jgi:hypothetical protein
MRCVKLDGARIQAVLLSLEICVVVDRRIASGKPEGKADGFFTLEGSSPVSGMASSQDTTGVLERGMYSWG